MISKKHMDSVEQLNKLPINQEARNWLRKAKADADPSQQYSLQLAMWGLDSGVVPVRENLTPLVENVLQSLMNPEADQQKSLEYLIQNDDQQEAVSSENLKVAKSAEDAASLLIDNCTARVMSDPKLRHLQM